MDYPYSLCIGGLNLVRVIDPKKISSSFDVAVSGQVSNIYSLSYTVYAVSYDAGETYVTKIDLSKPVPEVAWVYSTGILTLTGSKPTLTVIREFVYVVIPIIASGIINTKIIKLDLSGVKLIEWDLSLDRPEIICKTSKDMILVKYNSGTAVIDEGIVKSSITYKIQDAVVSKSGIIAAYQTSVYVLSDLLYEISQFDVGKMFTKLAIYSNDLVVGFSFNGLNNSVFSVDTTTGYLTNLFTINEIYDIDAFIAANQQIIFDSNPSWKPGDKFTVTNAVDPANNIEYTVVGNKATIAAFPDASHVTFTADPLWPAGYTFTIAGSTTNNGVKTIVGNVVANYEVVEVINVEPALGDAESSIYVVVGAIVDEPVSTAIGTLRNTPDDVTEFFVDRYSRFYIMDGGTGNVWYGTPGDIRESNFVFFPLANGKSMSGSQALHDSEPYSPDHIEFMKDDTSETMLSSLSLRSGVYGLTDYIGTSKSDDGSSFVYGPNYVLKINKNGNIVGTYSTIHTIIDISTDNLYVWVLTNSYIYTLHKENLSLQKMFAYIVPGVAVPESITSLRNNTAFLTFPLGVYEIVNTSGQIVNTGTCVYPLPISTTILLFGKKPKYCTSFDGVVIPIKGGTDVATTPVPAFVLYTRGGTLITFGDVFMPRANTYVNRIYPTNDGFLYYLWNNAGQVQLDELSETVVGSSYTELLADLDYGEIATTAYGDIILFKLDDVTVGQQVILMTKDFSGLTGERWNFDMDGDISSEGVLTLSESIYNPNLGVDLLTWKGNEIYDGQIKTWAGYDYDQNKLKLLATGTSYSGYSVSWNVNVMISMDGGPYASYPLVDVGNGVYSTSISLGIRPLYVIARFEITDIYNSNVIKRNHIISFVRR